MERKDIIIAEKNDLTLVVSRFTVGDPDFYHRVTVQRPLHPDVVFAGGVNMVGTLSIIYRTYFNPGRLAPAIQLIAENESKILEVVKELWK